ncbi:MAG: hypothetical protein ABIR96_07510 [Bdellovibrionota bacterium]
MRQVWVLSDDTRVQSRLSAAFIESRYHVKYRVQVARALSEVPEKYWSDAGVTFFVDAFSSSSPGFEGLKELRAKGFEGPVFLLGEPAPEDAADPFLHDALTGFLPPIDRCDMFLAAGLAHAFHHFDGELDLKWFLDTGGKAAFESIQSIKDFNQLVMKLTSFVSKFGADVQKLKRALVALSSSHVKNTPTGPNVIKPFKLCYGMDSGKLILAVSLEADDMRNAAFLEDFGATLSQVKGQGKSAPAHRSDILNVAKVTSNLIFLGGSASPGPAPHAFILTTIAFTKGQSVQVDPYFFSYVKAKVSTELDETLDPISEVEENFSPKTTLELAPPVAPAPTPAPVAPTKKKELFEPNVLGDKPREISKAQQPATGSSLSSYTPPETVELEDVSSSADPELAKKYEAIRNELETHRKLSEALAADVKRLMKERREPLTDADLKESLNELNARMKHLQEQNKKLNEIKSQKEAQIELLTAQVERLKMTAA